MHHPEDEPLEGDISLGGGAPTKAARKARPGSSKEEQKDDKDEDEDKDKKEEEEEEEEAEDDEDDDKEESPSKMKKAKAFAKKWPRFISKSLRRTLTWPTT